MAYCELDNSPPGRNQASNVPRSSFRMCRGVRLRATAILLLLRSYGKMHRALTSEHPDLAAARSREIPAPHLRGGARRARQRQSSVRRHPGGCGGRGAARSRDRLHAGPRHDRPCRAAARHQASKKFGADFLAGCTLPFCPFVLLEPLTNVVAPHRTGALSLLKWLCLPLHPWL